MVITTWKVWVYLFIQSIKTSFKHLPSCCLFQFMGAKMFKAGEKVDAAYEAM